MSFPSSNYLPEYGNLFNTDGKKDDLESLLADGNLDFSNLFGSLGQPNNKGQNMSKDALKEYQELSADIFGASFLPMNSFPTFDEDHSVSNDLASINALISDSTSFDAQSPSKPSTKPIMTSPFSPVDLEQMAGGSVNRDFQSTPLHSVPPLPSSQQPLQGFSGIIPNLDAMIQKFAQENPNISPELLAQFTRMLEMGVAPQFTSMMPPRNAPPPLPPMPSGPAPLPPSNAPLPRGYSGMPSAPHAHLPPQYYGARRQPPPVLLVTHTLAKAVTFARDSSFSRYKGEVMSNDEMAHVLKVFFKKAENLWPYDAAYYFYQWKLKLWNVSSRDAVEFSETSKLNTIDIAAFLSEIGENVMKSNKGLTPASPQSVKNTAVPSESTDVVTNVIDARKLNDLLPSSTKSERNVIQNRRDLVQVHENRRRDWEKRNGVAGKLVVTSLVKQREKISFEGEGAESPCPFPFSDLKSGNSSVWASRKRLNDLSKVFLEVEELSRRLILAQQQISDNVPELAIVRSALCQRIAALLGLKPENLIPDDFSAIPLSELYDHVTNSKDHNGISYVNSKVLLPLIRLSKGKKAIKKALLKLDLNDRGTLFLFLVQNILSVVSHAKDADSESSTKDLVAVMCEILRMKKIIIGQLTNEDGTPVPASTNPPLYLIQLDSLVKLIAELYHSNSEKIKLLIEQPLPCDILSTILLAGKEITESQLSKDLSPELKPVYASIESKWKATVDAISRKYVQQRN